MRNRGQHVPRPARSIGPLPDKKAFLCWRRGRRTRHGMRVARESTQNRQAWTWCPAASNSIPKKGSAQPLRSSQLGIWRTLCF